MNEMTVRVNGTELILERVFEAKRELVFKAFTEAEHLKRWWGPRGWELPVCKVDFRPGGVWHYCMKCVDENQGEFFGMESWGKAVYREIQEPERFTYTDYFSDAEGDVPEGLPPSEIEILFEEQDGRTKVISRSRFGSEEELRTVMDMGMEQGIRETWDRLAEHLTAVQ
ncbi:SRPBCC domain-containing protein [Paenibacillus sp. HN-1]|nr:MULTISPECIES: SRPBCC domain-containing protein [Paenibacillus]MBY9077892.1 SRPBCC domain-containing protein [Paenibacillus sp. CGMCC 1.18879]MBY9088152.1 SRPBCC domain-containing protein [Paenibacillus sinensis]